MTSSPVLVEMSAKSLVACHSCNYPENGRHSIYDINIVTLVVADL